MASAARRATWSPERLAAENERRRAYDQARRAADPEAERRRVRTWAAANPEKKRASARASYARYAEQRRQEKRDEYLRDPAAVRRRNAAWEAANRHKLQAIRQRRRDREAGQITASEWADILAEFEHRCAYCNVESEVLAMEHMLPVSRGGRTTRHNIVPACKSCNSRKHTKTALEFAGRAA